MNFLSSDFFKRIFVSCSMLLLVASCGSDEGENKDDVAESCEGLCVGQAQTKTFTTANQELTFPEGELGAQYVIMPFALGEQGTWDGGNPANTEVTFQITTAEGTSDGTVPENLKLYNPEVPKNLIANSQNRMSLNKYRELNHRLFNRFEPSLGLHQESGFWQLAEKLDQQSIVHFDDQSFEESLYVDNNRVAFFKLAIKNYGERKKNHSLVQSVCLDEITTPDGNDGIIVGPNFTLEAKDSYCLYYEKSPVNPANLVEIHEFISKVLNKFKSTIYTGTFPSGEDYKFIPHIVILDVEGDNYPGSSYLGAFNGPISFDDNRPIIYMPHDMSKIDGFDSSSDQKLVKRTWYATVVHELQHAYLHYYRTISTGAQSGRTETTNIDEGLAHYVEDLFGYGDLSFKSKIGAFLNGFPGGTVAFLPSSSLSSETALRGPMQTISLYLAGQGGDVAFENGEFQSGGGLDFVKAIATNDPKVTGPLTYQKIIGKNMPDIMGNYLSALVLDGRKFDKDLSIAAEFKSPAYVTGVKDFSGNEGGVFGADFNNFEGIEQPIVNSDNLTDLDEDGIELSLFHSKPVIYTVSKSGTKLLLTADEEIANTAVTVVRIK